MFVFLTRSSQCQVGYLGKEAGRPRRVIPQGGTDPWPHQQHRLTEAEHITRAGAGNGAHRQFQTEQVENQVQGPSMGSRQEQKQTGPERGLEHRSKGSFQQMGYLQ